MRALTVRQPWAQAIVSGIKTVENRSRNIAGSYRGSLLIHAGAQWDRTAFDSPVMAEWLASQWGITRDNWTGTSLPTGCILGAVDLTRVHPACTPEGLYCGGLDAFYAPVTCSPWALPDHHHLVLANARPFDDRPRAKGKLGLWTPSDDLLSLLPLEDS